MRRQEKWTGEGKIRDRGNLETTWEFETGGGGGREMRGLWGHRLRLRNQSIRTRKKGDKTNRIKTSYQTNHTCPHHDRGGVLKLRVGGEEKPTKKRRGQKNAGRVLQRGEIWEQTTKIKKQASAWNKRLPRRCLGGEKTPWEDVSGVKGGGYLTGEVVDGGRGGVLLVS